MVQKAIQVDFFQTSWCCY